MTLSPSEAALAAVLEASKTLHTTMVPPAAVPPSAPPPAPPPAPPSFSIEVLLPSELAAFTADDAIWIWLASLLEKTTRPVLLWGPPDTGKSWAAKTMALGSRRMWAAHLTEDSPAAELRGYERVTDGNMVWSNGPMLRAWEGNGGTGDRLVVEEIDKAGGDTLTMCLAAADDPRIAQIVLPTGQIVKPRPGYQCIATSNESPDTLLPELRSRFAICIHVTMPPPAAFEQLMPELRPIARAAMKDTNPARRIGMRSWTAFQELVTSGLSVKLAATLAFGSRAPDILAAAKLRKV